MASMPSAPSAPSAPPAPPAPHGAAPSVARSAPRAAPRATPHRRLALLARRAVPGTLGLLLLAPASRLPGQDPWAPDSRIGDFQFNMPAGWKRATDRNGNPILVPTDLAPGSIAYIGFLPPEPLTGTLRSWFDAQWAQVTASGLKAVDRYDPQPGRTAQGFERLRLYTRVSSPAFGFAQFVFAAAQVGNRVQAYMFLSTANRYSYVNDLEAFEQSLQFATAPPSIADRRGRTPAAGGAAAGAGMDGGLDGLYIGYRMRGATPFERTHFEYLVFFPDGNALRFLPDSGLEHFVNFAAEVKKSRPYCGRYRVTGNEVTILWGDNSTETATRSPGEAGTAPTLKIGGDSYFPVSRSDGLVLDGTYRREGADLARAGIRFTPDGRFAENGMLPLVAYALTEDRHLSQAPGSGTYRIARNTLTLQYQDGRTVPLSFFIFPAEAGPRPGAIHVETFRLVRDR